MTTEFRNRVLLWKYNKDRDGDESECIPYQLQLLFARLLLSERGATETGQLTKSFGWTSTEVYQQQDVQVCPFPICAYLFLLFDCFQLFSTVSL